MAGIIVYPLFTLATVPNGGTGATSFTANGVLYGNGTAALQVTAQGVANSILTANAGAPSFSQAPVIQTSVTIGVAGAATGQLLLRGTTSGTVTTTVAAAAGTWTLTLPTGAGTANFALTTDGTGLSSWVSGQSIAGLLTTSDVRFSSVGIGVAASGVAGRLTVNENLIVSGVGSHAIGSATDARASLVLGGTFAPGATNPSIGTWDNRTITVVSGNSGYLNYFAGQLTKAGAGTHPVMANAYFGMGNTSGASTVTDTANVYIATFSVAGGTNTNATGLWVAAPTGATNNRAIYVSSGDVRLSTSIAGTGETSTISLTGSDNTASPRSTGVGTIKFADVTSRDNIGFWKLMIATTAYYIPVFAAN